MADFLTSSPESKTYKVLSLYWGKSLDQVWRQNKDTLRHISKLLSYVHFPRKKNMSSSKIEGKIIIYSKHNQ